MWFNSFIHFIVKYTLFLLNLVFTISGLVLAVAGIAVYLKFKDSLQTSTGTNLFYEQTLQSLSIFVITFGIIVFIVAFCGCWGSVTEKKYLLVMYSVFMTVLIVPMIYGAVEHNKNKNLLQNTLRDGLKASLNSEKTEMLINGVEFWLHCCGTDGPDFYDSRMRSMGLPSGILPPTCCAKKVTSLDQVVPMYEKYMNMLKFDHSVTEDVCTTDRSDSAKDGCFKVLTDYVDYYGDFIKRTNYAVIAFEGLELIGAIYLCSSISHKKKKYNKHY